VELEGVRTPSSKSFRSSRGRRSSSKAALAVSCAESASLEGSTAATARSHRGLKQAWDAPVPAEKPAAEVRSHRSGRRRPSSCSSCASSADYQASMASVSTVALHTTRALSFETVSSKNSSSSLLSVTAAREPAESDSSVIGPNWISGHQLGRGSYGSVCRAFDPDSGRIFAVKKTTVDSDERANRALEEELRICQDLRHPHIVGYLGHLRVDNALMIYLEFCAGGSIASILNEFGPLEEEMLRRASSGMLEGLAYLHEHKPCVVHRDIKGANLLVDLHFNVKLADFGCSKSALVSQSFTTIGSVPWMAPEVIQQQMGYGRKADIWSAGCTIIEMATAEKPWGNGAFDNMMAAMMRIGMTEATPPIPESAPPPLQDLIRACVQRDPELRPQAAELLEHNFLRGLSA